MAGRADARRNRDRILDAAAAVLSTGPGATLGEIAEAAGVSRATIYRHFSDVDAVRAALVDEAQGVGRDVLQEHLPPLLSRRQAPVTEDFLELIRNVLPMEHRWTKVIAGEPMPHAEFHASFGPTARALIRRAQAAGEYRADLDVEMVADALISLAMFAVRKVHAEGVPVDRALDILRPYLDGMKPAARR